MFNLLSKTWYQQKSRLCGGGGGGEGEKEGERERKRNANKSHVSNYLFLSPSFDKNPENLRHC